MLESAPMIRYLLATKQVSIYCVFASLIVTAAMMHPSFSTLVIAVPVNAIILMALRWVAHQEGKMLDQPTRMP